MRDLYNFIDSQHVPARSGQWLDDRAPATDAVIARIARSGAEDVNDAVAAAKRAAPAWARTSTAEGADLCDAIADVLDKRLDDLADLESRDAGKTITQARMIDIPRAVRNFRFFAGAVRHDETGCHEMSDALNYTLPIRFCTNRLDLFRGRGLDQKPIFDHAASGLGQMCRMKGFSRPSFRIWPQGLRHPRQGWSSRHH